MSDVISRRQAWCKIAVLIADGLPTPTTLSISDDRVSMTVEEHAGFLAWAAKLNASVERDGKPFVASSGYHLYTARLDDWHGRSFHLDVHIQPDAQVADDMRLVRHVANHGPAEAVSGG